MAESLFFASGDGVKCYSSIGISYWQIKMQRELTWIGDRYHKMGVGFTTNLGKVSFCLTRLYTEPGTDVPINKGIWKKADHKNE